MFKFSCTCQNYNGYLHASKEECYFISPLLRVDLHWSNVKQIKLDTKQIKSVPTSVLVIGLSRNVAAEDDEDSASGRKKKKKNASKKYFFYGFQDLLSAEERVKGMWAAWKEAAAVGEQVRIPNETASASDADSITGRPDDEVGSNGSTRGGRDRTDVASKNPLTVRPSAVTESRPTVLSPSSPPRRTPPPSSARTQQGLDILAPPTDSVLRRTVEKAMVDTVRITNVVLHLFIRGGPVAVLALAVTIVACVALVEKTRYSLSAALLPPTVTPFVETRRLLDAVQRVGEHHHSLGQYASLGGFREAQRQRPTALESSDVWLERLESAAAELAEKYVTVQTEMLNLRGRRAERFLAAEVGLSFRKPGSWHSVFHKGDQSQRRYFLADPAAPDDPVALSGDGEDGAAASNGHASGKKAAKKRRLISVSRVLEDLQFWRRIASVIRDRLPFSGKSLKGSETLGKRGLLHFFTDAPDATDNVVRYTEPFLDGFDLVQYVSADEAWERQECRRISAEMVQLWNAVQTIFAWFSSLLLSESYEGLAYGHDKPHFWNAPPPSTALFPTPAKGGGAHGEDDFVFSSDDTLRVIFVRRYLEALLLLNPLEPSDQRRRADALEAARRMLRFTMKENRLSERLSQSDKDALAEAFYKTAMPRHFSSDGSATGPATTLRNVLVEMRFWEHHEDLWMEHLLRSLPADHREKLQELADRRLRQRRGGPAAGESQRRGLNSSDHQIQWKGLPVFKGLLCFSPLPELRVPPPQSDLSHAKARSRFPLSSLWSPYAAKTPPPAPPGEGTTDEAEEADEGTDVDYGGEEETAHRDGEGDGGGSGGGPEAAVHSQDAHGQHHYRGPNKRVAEAHRAAFPRPHKSSPTVEDEFRRVFNPSRLGNTVDVCKERWMGELDVFLDAVAPTRRAGATGRRARRADRALHLEHDVDATLPELSAVRLRLFSLVDRLNKYYLLPALNAQSGFLSLLGQWLWPPSWIRWLLRARSTTALDAIRSMATADPAVQLAAVQVVETPWGTDKDAPLILLKNVVLQPPELVSLRASVRNQLAYTWTLLTISVVVLMAVHMFF